MIIAAALLFALALAAFLAGEATWNLRWWSVALLLAVAAIAVVFVSAAVQLLRR